jgi:hypothetical protein
MQPDVADRTSAALSDAWLALLEVHPDAWIEVGDGVSAYATGLPSPALNGVTSARRDPDPEEIRRLVAGLRDRGVPHMLQLRPGTDPAAMAVADEEGLVSVDDVPLMRLDEPASLARGAAAAPELGIRQIGPDEASLHAQTAGAGFEEDPEIFTRLLPPVVMAMDGLRTYVGELGGEVVTTAVGFTRDDCVGIFNVATPVEHRRRGYGAAVTARAAADGLAAGARWAWLQSSPSGYRVYETLGFRALESWHCWVRV